MTGNNFKFLLLFVMSVICSTNLGKCQQNIPPINMEIIQYVKSVMGTTVDRGECWDLANQALKRSHAIWDGQLKYGKLIDPNKEVVFPGDIIQFDHVQVKFKRGDTTFTENMKQHTAVVFKVVSKGKFVLAHQNTDFSGRKVGVSQFDIYTVVKGKMYFYRPQR